MKLKYHSENQCIRILYYITFTFFNMCTSNTFHKVHKSYGKSMCEITMTCSFIFFRDISLHLPSNFGKIRNCMKRVFFQEKNVFILLRGIFIKIKIGGRNLCYGQPGVLFSLILKFEAKILAPIMHFQDCKHLCIFVGGKKRPLVVKKSQE